MIRFKTLTVGFVLTLMLATLAHAVFVLPESMVVPIRADSATGTGYSDMVHDGIDTPLISGGSPSPVELAFSDLVSGPDVGLGDGLGSGVVVTVWGYGLGSSQGPSTIEFCDAASVCRAGHVYYWKNADGVAPSGPANLYESHGMQEIAFSIPDSASGPGSIRVTVGSDVDTLPFIVRAGNIYHVKPTGSDSNPGTFDQPWLTGNRAGNGLLFSSSILAPAGSTVYFHGSTNGGINTSGANRGIYNNNSAATAPDSTTNFFYVAYPGTHSLTSGQEGFTNYQLRGTAISKFRIEASNCPEIANGQRGACVAAGTWGVRTDGWGRVIANYLTDQPGRCASRFHGAITGSAESEDNVSNVKIFGNEIEEYGCYASNALHHTMYMTIRSAPNDLTVEPWEFGWNYLHDNDAKSGIHSFDEGDNCGTASGPVIMRNNVVVNQAGPGIYFGGQCGWEMDAYIENNVVINGGRPAYWNGVDVGTQQQTEPGGITIRASGEPPLGGLLGRVYIRNNIIHGWGWDELVGNSVGEGCLSLTGGSSNVNITFTDNICVTARNLRFLGNNNNASAQPADVIGDGNAFYYSGAGTPTAAVPPAFDANPITTNPLLTITGVRVSVGAGSPVLDQSNTALLRDIYGTLRSKPNSNVGSVE